MRGLGGGCTLLKPALLKPALLKPALLRPALLRIALLRPALLGIALVGIALGGTASAGPAAAVAAAASDRAEAPAAASGPVLAAGPAAPLAMRQPTVSRASDRVLCTFDTGTLDEVSGIATSLQHPGIVWMTNDSGGGPYLYAVDTSDCSIRATLHLLDTPARDHEALAMGTDARGRAVIWIGDIGDNLGSWPYVRIHAVVEPERLHDADVAVTTYRFTYPEGPQDAEALIAAPDREQLWVITKGDGGGSVYALPSPMSDSRTPMSAERLGSARAMVTDAAMAPDGQRYVVRDYFSAEVFTGDPIGQPQARFRLPLQPQGESITWTADSQRLLIASEGSGALVEVTPTETALGTDEGIAAALPRVAGFDIYPLLRIGVVALAALVAVALLTRLFRRRRRRR